MRYAWIGCALAFGLGVAACSGGKSGDDDDDNGGDSGAGSGGTSAMGGTGGSSGKGGSGGTAGTGAKGGSGGTGGTGGSGGSATQPIPGGPFPYPQNKKPPHCDLTTYSNASGAVSNAYAFWKGTFVVSATGGLRVQRTENANDTVSEGIGYGMLIAVYMNDKATFDGIWSFAKLHLDSSGLMNWHLNPDGSIAAQGMGSATDADEDMAYALVMASAQWQSGTYLDEAKKMINAIMANSVAGDGTLKPGDAWGATDRTYPDYFAPSYFRVFKALTNNANWDIVIKRNYEILAQVSGQYGLVPDFTDSKYSLSENYKYDACRTPWRIGLDYCQNGTPEALTYLQKVGGFFDMTGVSNIGDGYSNTGSRTSSFGNMAFIGPAGVAGMAGYPKLLNDAFAYGANGNGGSQNYFAQSLRVITMLVMSGNFVDFTQP